MLVLDIITRNIREVLKMRNMSEADFCKELGVGHGYFDRKRDDIGITRLLKAAEILEIRPENLWDEEFTVEAKKQALKGEIERLTRELEALEPFMHPPVEDTLPKK